MSFIVDGILVYNDDGVYNQFCIDYLKKLLRTKFTCKRTRYRIVIRLVKFGFGFVFVP